MEYLGVGYCHLKQGRSERDGCEFFLLRKIILLSLILYGRYLEIYIFYKTYVAEIEGKSKTKSSIHN
jgi:hypothetical protein